MRRQRTVIPAGRIRASSPSRTTKPLLRRALTLAGISAGLLVALGAGAVHLREPAADRDWTPDNARVPEVRFDGNTATVHNVRNFEWRSESEYTERWKSRTYDLGRLESVWFIIESFGDVRPVPPISVFLWTCPCASAAFRGRSDRADQALRMIIPPAPRHCPSMVYHGVYRGSSPATLDRNRPGAAVESAARGADLELALSAANRTPRHGQWIA